MSPLSVQVDLNDNMIAEKQWQWQKQEHKKAYEKAYTTSIGASLQIILAGSFRSFALRPATFFSLIFFCVYKKT
jgi:hypothetical protein